MATEKPERLLRVATVLDRTGLSRRTILRYEYVGEFPRRVKLGGGRAVGWYESEIDRWVSSRERAVS